MKCQFGDCPENATWVNGNGAIVCPHHKLLLNAFTWENRNKRKWRKLSPNQINRKGVNDG